MLNELFDTVKGLGVAQHSTICEFHRQLYDEIILNINDPKLMRKMVDILSKAFARAISMNAELLLRNLNYEEALCSKLDESERSYWIFRRAERIERVKKLFQDKDFMKIYNEQ